MYIKCSLCKSVLCSEHRALCTILGYCALNAVLLRGAAYKYGSTLHTVHCTLYTVHCTLHTKLNRQAYVKSS